MSDIIPDGVIVEPDNVQVIAKAVAEVCGAALRTINTGRTREGTQVSDVVLLAIATEALTRAQMMVGPLR